MLNSINRMLRDLKSHTGGNAILLTAIGLIFAAPKIS